MIVFVGDRPSRLNEDPGIAFVGTPSCMTLFKWIQKLDIVAFTMVNSYDHADGVKICKLYNNGHRVFVALGNNASKRLNGMGISHFKLPHPSPRNRMLNDKKLIASELEKCYLYLKEQKEKCASFVPNGKKVS